MFLQKEDFLEVREKIKAGARSKQRALARRRGELETQWEPLGRKIIVTVDAYLWKRIKEESEAGRIGPEYPIPQAEELWPWKR